MTLGKDSDKKLLYHLLLTDNGLTYLSSHLAVHSGDLAGEFRITSTGIIR